MSKVNRANNRDNNVYIIIMSKVNRAIILVDPFVDPKFSFYKYKVFKKFNTKFLSNVNRLF